MLYHFIETNISINVCLKKHNNKIPALDNLRTRLPLYYVSCKFAITLQVMLRGCLDGSLNFVIIINKNKFIRNVNVSIILYTD